MAPAPLVVEGPIVLVTLESLRADAVGELGGPAEDTPNLDRLIAEARASGGFGGRAVAPSSWTAPVLASLLTGLESWQHEVLHAGRNRLGTDAPTLAERFAERGWPTRAFAQGRRLGTKAGFGRGFAATSPTREDGHYRAAEYLRERAPGRELVWIHLSRPSSIFERNRLGELPVDRLRTDYRDYVRWIDRQLAPLFSGLAETGQWETAMVVVVACQGQDLDDPGPRGLGGNVERSLIEVPLAVKLPAGASRRLGVPETARVGTVRLYATLLEAAGISPPPAVEPSLFAASTPPILSELYLAGGANQFSVVDGDLQLIQKVVLTDPAAPTVEILRRFQETLPLSGRGDTTRRVVRWLPGTGTEAVTDSTLETRLGAELENTWLAFVERERAPSAERWAIRTR